MVHYIRVLHVLPEKKNYPISMLLYVKKEKFCLLDFFTIQRMAYLKTSIPSEAMFAVSSSEIAREGGRGFGGRGSRGKGRGEGRRGRERGRGVYPPCS
jgi:hypothetical protein